MTRNYLLLLGLAVAVGGTGCPGDDKDDSAEESDTDTDTDTDTDSDLAQIADDVGEYKTTAWTLDIVGEGSITGGGDDFEGELTYSSSEDGATICDATIALEGTEYTGDCTDCEFAFEMEATVTDDGGTSDCYLDPYWTYVEDGIAYDPIMAYQPEYTYESYWGYDYDFSNVLTTGLSFDYTAYGYGTYPGPYWRQMIFTYSGYEYGELDVDGDDVAWSYSDYGYTYDKNYYSYCYTAYSSYSDVAYGGSLVGYSGLDCGYGSTGYSSIDDAHMDVWEVNLTAGDMLSVTIDTVAADSAFDPAMFINGPDSCADIWTDDNFDCTYEPAAYQCPSALIEADEDGTYEIAVWSYGSCTGDVADYKLIVGVNEE